MLGPETAALFRYWECGASLFGKARKLRKLVLASGHANDVVIYVGDEIRDVDAAREARIAFGAVAWGFTHLQSLVAQGVTETFSDRTELVTKLTPEATIVRAMPRPRAAGVPTTRGVSLNRVDAGLARQVSRPRSH